MTKLDNRESIVVSYLSLSPEGGDSAVVSAHVGMSPPITSAVLHRARQAGLISAISHGRWAWYFADFHAKTATAAFLAAREVRRLKRAEAMQNMKDLGPQDLPLKGKERQIVRIDANIAPPIQDRGPCSVFEFAQFINRKEPTT
jgi:hypothetical protein